ncbi:MAG: hypothetical protein BroJett003_27570 [Planctomycetota bacterium]|nr:MAG: hypothetical protein BroJett003_27570 [Planctomycetota bacterium]
MRGQWMRLLQRVTLLAAGASMLQVGGCNSTTALEFLQTVFLGVSAAGAYAILQNI